VSAAAVKSDNAAAAVVVVAPNTTASRKRRRRNMIDSLRDLHEDPRGCCSPDPPPSPSPPSVTNDSPLLVEGSSSSPFFSLNMVQQRINALSSNHRDNNGNSSHSSNQTVTTEMMDTGSPPPLPSSSSLLVRMGKSIALSVEMFATVGETIGEANSDDIRAEMVDAGRESRSVGANLEKLCEALSADHAGETIGGDCNGSSDIHGFALSPNDLETVVRVLRRLLAAVTRVLLLADNTVVKQLLTSKQEQPDQAGEGSATAQTVLPSPDQASSMETMHHFTEFAKAFCDFGTDMVHFIQMFGE
jgi:hypothetical protein